MGFRSYFDSSSSGGGGGTPGGVNGDLQYNNAGAFGGLTPGIGVATLLAGTPSGTGGLVGTTSPTFTTGISVNNGSSAFVITATGTNGGITLTTNGTGRTEISGKLNVNAGTFDSAYCATFHAVDDTANSGIKVWSNNQAAFCGVSYLGLACSTSMALQSGSSGGNAIIFKTLGGTESGRIAINGLWAIGNGVGVPTYGIQANGTGWTANQTMLVQDATLVTGSTGIFFNAGVAQSGNPVLTVQGSNSIQAAGIIKGTLTTLANAVTGLIAGALAALTNASIVITDGTGTVYRIPCVTP